MKRCQWENFRTDVLLRQALVAGCRPTLRGCGYPATTRATTSYGAHAPLCAGLCCTTVLAMFFGRGSAALGAARLAGPAGTGAREQDHGGTRRDRPLRAAAQSNGELRSSQAALGAHQDAHSSGSNC